MRSITWNTIPHSFATPIHEQIQSIPGFHVGELLSYDRGTWILEINSYHSPSSRDWNFRMHDCMRKCWCNRLLLFLLLFLPPSTQPQDLPLTGPKLTKQLHRSMPQHLYWWSVNLSWISWITRWFIVVFTFQSISKYHCSRPRCGCLLRALPRCGSRAASGKMLLVRVVGISSQPLSISEWYINWLFPQELSRVWMKHRIPINPLKISF